MTDPVMQVGGRLQNPVPGWELRYTVGGVRLSVQHQAWNCFWRTARPGWTVWRAIRSTPFAGAALEISWRMTRPIDRPMLREFAPRP